MSAPAPFPDPTSFPADGSAAERLRFLVGYAVLAPSDRNTQPWHFRVEGDTLELWADRSRGLPVGDPGGRALTISCGAALYHLRLALRHFGFEAVVECLPDAAQPDLLARVGLGAPRPPAPVEELLFDAIPRRRTNRRAFADRFLPSYLLQALQSAAAAEEGRLVLVTSAADKAELAALVADADRAQQADPALREERAGWIHTASDPRHDGLSGYALGIPAVMDVMTPLLARAFRRDADGARQAARDAERAEGPGVLAVLATDADDAAAWLQTGEALAHVLLRAAAAGVSASFLNAPVEVSRYRAELARRTSGHPQLLFRLGFGPALAYATPRRGAEDVMDNSAPLPFLA